MVLSFAALLALSAQGELNVTPEETRVESAAYMGCIKRQANALDDKVSDAATIAKAVMLKCDGEMRAFVAKLSTGQNERRHEALLSAFRERFEADAIVAVLANRIK
jgi:ribosomal protein S12 methylthiotransferase accessory factor YcaO